MDWVSYDVLLSRSTFSTQILLLWHTEMVTTQYGTVSLFGICGGFLVGTKIPCFDRRLKIEQSHHHFPRHWKLRHLPLEPMYQEADHRRTTRCCTYHPQVPSRHAFWMLIYLFLVCICLHFGGKCRTVDMACQFWLARRKSTSIQILQFLQGIFLRLLLGHRPSGIPCIWTCSEASDSPASLHTLEAVNSWSDLWSLSVTPLSDPRLTKACCMSLFFSGFASGHFFPFLTKADITSECMEGREWLAQECAHHFANGCEVDVPPCIPCIGPCIYQQCGCEGWWMVQENDGYVCVACSYSNVPYFSAVVHAPM